MFRIIYSSWWRVVIVMWNDIDLYHAFRDFTTDPVSFPGEEVRSFIQELVSLNVFYRTSCQKADLVGSIVYRLLITNTVRPLNVQVFKH